jgi:hypothetical protein
MTERTRSFGRSTETLLLRALIVCWALPLACGRVTANATKADAGTGSDGSGAGPAGGTGGGGAGGRLSSGLGGTTAAGGGSGACAGTATACGGGCVDLQTSSSDCGACGYACINGRTCSAGRCTPAWQPIATANGPGTRTADAAASVGGRFYVMGGAPTCSGSSPAAFAYDPSTDTWSTVAPMNASRSQHVAVAVNATIYVYGGISDCANGGSSTYGGLEAYNPNANTWTTLTTSNQITERYATSMIWTGSDFFVFGGAGQSGFDPRSGGTLDFASLSWTGFTCLLDASSDPYHCARSNQSMFYSGGTVYVFGGFVPVDNNSSPGGLAYNIAASTWNDWSAPSGPVNGQVYSADDGARMFFVTGTEVAMFSEATLQWLAPDTSLEPSNMGTAVLAWTGSEVIGWTNANSGGRYQPPSPQ